ncbi:MAG: hypothetical protein JWO20_3284 [Candidatus Angelobacter sp.]|nr:hypothetical protein [Candidatus Angelobacter sp.]
MNSAGQIAVRLIVVLLLVPVSALAQNAIATNTVPNYKPITISERGKWFVVSTVGPMSLFVAGPLSAGLGTWRDRPEEYGTSWEGFGKRYGIRLTGVSTGNAIEASLGAVWGEDPRYFRSPDQAFGPRVKHVVKATFMAPGVDGRWRPAYARYAGNIGNNFLSNTWRAESENSAGDAVVRCISGVAGRMAGNAFKEFWPTIKRKVFKK